MDGLHLKNSKLTPPYTMCKKKENGGEKTTTQKNPRHLMATTVLYPYVCSTCGNVGPSHLLNQRCHRSSGSDTVSGEKEMKTGKKAQLMTSSYASVHLLMSFQGEAGRAGAKAELGCERPRPSLPCCDPCLPTHKEPQLPATNEC